MEEEFLLQLKTEPDKVIAKIKEQSKDSAKILAYQKEYKEHDRTIRETQVGNIQKDKNVGNGEKAKLVRAVRIPIDYQKKIVSTATAFEVGKPVTLIPSEVNDLSELIKMIWKTNRIDSLLQKLISLKKAETQGAIQFYITDIKENSLFGKILNFLKLKSQAKEIKSKLLDNTKGVMTPFFVGDNMVAFMWEYKAKNAAGKELNHLEIWDELNYHYLNDESGKIAYVDKSLPHGFDRIPIVYVGQDEPEWFIVRELIDRYETSLSKLGGSNDYTAYPLLQIFGEVNSFPDRDDNGKILEFKIKVDDDGKEHHGRAEFLTAANAADRAKLEFDNVKDLIYSISHTPDLSFNNLKGMGDVSGVALKLMFLDAVIKATMNEGDNRTTIERILNVITSGVVKTTNTSLAKFALTLYYDIIFNSIIPDDVKTATDIITSLKAAGLLSTLSAIKLIDMVENPDEELKLINAEKPIVAPEVLT
ncbi:SPP1 family phage portal protein [Flavobacterium chryseum]|uniref:phage portal protein n=1 Tax=Flavobacterium sp. P3160 TaxID=2512113 RepID=UPI00105F0C0F|nr:phage portal protein [Flavobacterium sp. P3160]TDO68746.1 SPP1 family phage portal protein [Flavobacterium sp. P3160]